MGPINESEILRFIESMQEDSVKSEEINQKVGSILARLDATSVDLATRDSLAKLAFQLHRFHYSEAAKAVGNVFTSIFHAPPREVQKMFFALLNAKELAMTASVSHAFREFSDEARIDLLNQGLPIQQLGLTGENLKKFLTRKSEGSLLTNGERIKSLNTEKASLPAFEIIQLCPNVEHLFVPKYYRSPIGTTPPLSLEEIQWLANSEQATKLKTLNLDWIDESAVVALAASTKLSNLTSLALRHSMGNEGVTAIAQSSAFPNLRALDLSSNGMTSEGIRALFASQNLHLKQLKLAEIRFDADACRALAQWENAASIESLDLEGNFLNGAVQNLTGEETRLINLKILKAPGCGLDDADLQAIVNRFALTELDLEFNQLTAAGAAAIADSEKSSSLLKLTLADNPIASIGLEKLVGSPYLHLTELDLSACGITTITPLQSENHSLTSLTTLILDNNYEMQLDGFTNLPHLQKFGLQGHTISPENFTALIERLNALKEMTLSAQPELLQLEQLAQRRGINISIISWTEKIPLKIRSLKLF